MDRPSSGLFFGGEGDAWQRRWNHPARSTSHRSEPIVLVARRAHPSCNEWERVRRGSANPSLESRPAEPGASCRSVSSRLDSSIAGLDTQASCFSLLRRRELGFVSSPRDVRRGP
jgi:hypothetical protein